MLRLIRKTRDLGILVRSLPMKTRNLRIFARSLWIFVRSLITKTVIPINVRKSRHEDAEPLDPRPEPRGQWFRRRGTVQAGIFQVVHEQFQVVIFFKSQVFEVMDFSSLEFSKCIQEQKIFQRR